ncbi:nickel-dependent lactate racemase [Paenibacillus sp. TRM 82003]|nr:nickel-dependent lactate racemase [Paenibacillus sp. TRM 82003]
MLFPYGDRSVSLPLPEASCDLLHYRVARGSDAKAPEAIIREALAAPIASPSLTELARGRRDAVILISDRTRLSPSHLLLPPILDVLNGAGIPDERIRVIVALGTHRCQTEAELRQLSGAAFERVRVENHSALPEDNVYVGTTTFGNDIALHPAVVQADLRIATGNVEPHRLVGMSGGVKALFPGVASRDSIARHHARSLQDQAAPGYTDNSLYQELEEVAAMVPVEFLFNVVADHRKQPLAAFAGEPDAAHRSAISFARDCFLTPVNRLYDVVVASAGGAPKDMQLYQAIKSLENASGFAKVGGEVLLLARCEEIYGNAAFQEWTETHSDREKAIESLGKAFILGAHKLLLLDKVLRKVKVYLYSDIPDPIVSLLGFTPVNDLEEWVRARVTEGKAVAAMPCASLTFPEAVKNGRA